MNKQYFVYILSNYQRTVLYIGITNNLYKRIYEHRSESIEGFSKKYHTHFLLYYEAYRDSLSAIKREKQLKGWNRRKKNALIMKINPQLKDLYTSLSF